MGSNVVRAITYSKAGSIFCGTSSGIFRSLDFGMNWTEYNNGLESNNKNIFSIASGIDDIIYAGTALGIYKTQTPDDMEEIISEDFSLSAFPTPFKEKVNFKITNVKSGIYTLSIYDIFGRKIHNLFEGYLSLDTHQFEWYPENSGIGSYYYRINNEKHTTQGMILFLP